MKAMDYRKRNDKYIFSQDGVYFCMTKDQVKEMRLLCDEIIESSPTDEALDSFLSASKAHGW